MAGDTYRCSGRVVSTAGISGYTLVSVGAPHVRTTSWNKLRSATPDVERVTVLCEEHENPRWGTKRGGCQPRTSCKRLGRSRSRSSTTQKLNTNAEAMEAITIHQMLRCKPLPNTRMKICGNQLSR